MKESIQNTEPSLSYEDFEQTGPYEPITTRLRNILKEYKEGIGIFKELIQNADDAGANKVRLLVDWRQGPKEHLLCPEMAKCQGPALWAYNNAKFTEKDFENISKVAGETKLAELDKIGRFGLGFNAVYHLTDVPSIVSGEYFQIFDPNVTHIEKYIKDRSRPGIRINLNRKQQYFTMFSDQFQPYDNIFGCTTQENQHGEFDYKGTLFRFPFRTPSEAKESDICQTVYDVEKVKELVGSLRECASLLLLFSQHIMQVELYELPNNARDPDEMKLIISTTKSQLMGATNEPFINECANWWKQMLSLGAKSICGPSQKELVSIVTKFTASQWTDEEELVKWWLISSCVGTATSVRLASAEEGQKQGLLPCGSVAVQLEKRRDGISRFQVATTTRISGEAFCFLPLSIPTDLPVQVNGVFAIMSNRMEIWKRDTLKVHNQPLEVRWNEAILEDVLSNAYIKLLQEAKTLAQNGDLDSYEFHSFWPRRLPLKTWELLVQSVYRKIVAGNLELFYSNRKWMSIKTGNVLSDYLYNLRSDLRQSFVDILTDLNKSVFLLPPEVTSLLRETSKNVGLSTVSLRKFLADYLLPNLTNVKISSKKRDVVIGFALDHILSHDHDNDDDVYENNNEPIWNLLNDSSCIPVSKDGRHLVRPCELIHPNGEAAKLFTQNDHRFPVKQFLMPNRAYVLEQLGMVKDKLSCEELLERATSVERVGGEEGLELARNIINYLKKNIDDYRENAYFMNELRSIRFLPFMSDPPNDYCLKWRGTSERKQFVTSKELFLPSDLYVIGFTGLIIDVSPESGCGFLGQSLRHLLGFSDRSPEIKMVLKQLDEAIHTWRQIGVQNKYGFLKICKSIYRYFESLAFRVAKTDEESKKSSRTKSLYVRSASKKSLDILVNDLSQKPWLFIQGQFLSSERVAKNWEGNATPYIYKLPREYQDDYKCLVRVLEIKERFTIADFIEALKALSQAKKNQPLTDEELKTTAVLLSELKDGDEDCLRQYKGEIFLPDTKSVLCKAEKLTINPTPWYDNGEMKYVHEDIPTALAKQLGAMSLQVRNLEPYSSAFGSEFGQHEDLTDRLNNILMGYPCGQEILKELVQNADDAQATEIHFIHDTRTLPHENVFLENAQEIQGPALCVYNNRPFTENDLKGIQKLGVGSKRDDPLMTGQYGIGFNAVYHLTDFPSIFSNGDTLCFLDPELRYVPQASHGSPGRKFHPIDAKFRRENPSILDGYLGKYLPLRGGTVLRLPLRSEERSHESRISNLDGTDRIKVLLSLFKQDARKTLLFLSNLKKITLSVIKKDGELIKEYEVKVSLKPEDEKRRKHLTSLVAKNRNKPTNEVPWNSTVYPMSISDSNSITEKWLIHQSYGVSRNNEHLPPEVGRVGLLPRGGVAALITPSTDISTDHIAYCFLPLPGATTGLPVHVNGHFALDTARRRLWKDDSPNGLRTKWNNFIKLNVLASGYSELIREAKAAITQSNSKRDSVDETDSKGILDKETSISWYHQLFPDISKVRSDWKDMAMVVYHLLSAYEILPVIDDDYNIKRWVSPQVGFFPDNDYFENGEDKKVTGTNDDHEDNNDDENNRQIIMKILVESGYPLLCYSPSFIYHGFQAINFRLSQLQTPRSVVDFLRSRNCKIGTLPCKIEYTKIRSISLLVLLIKYCKEEEKFYEMLPGLPLLLTADGHLRRFETTNPVYCSEFSDLFPKHTDQFLHPKMVDILKIYLYHQAFLQVMPKLSVNAVAQFLPEIFPQKWRGTTRHQPWDFPETGVLSEQWFKRLWKFLQNEVEPERYKSQVSLDALREWPIIPTMSGSLVTIKNAKTVLDLTDTGSRETPRVKTVRELLKKLQCPCLNKAITLNERKPTLSSEVNGTLGKLQKKPVTNPYVAHPNNTLDVLCVLHYMQSMGTLDVSSSADSDIRELLLFFQNDHHEDQNQFLKKLPLYKSFDDRLVSLSTYRSYAIIPEIIFEKGFSTEILSLQQRTGWLFLHPDALPDLTTLYTKLGVKVPLQGIGTERSVCEFYTKYIWPNFNLFSRESQIEFLTLIRDDVLPLLPKKDEFWDSMKQLRCVPGQDGGLHQAKEFFSPKNEIYQAMFRDRPGQFPPPPFGNEAWLKLLGRMGLKEQVNQEQFLEFCQDLAKSEKVDDLLSRKLVEHFLTKEKLHGPRTFLRSLSTIKFIASERIYTGSIEYVQFEGSVRWEHRDLVKTTSTPLLPEWADPESRGLKKDLIDILGVLREPCVDSVVDNLKNISSDCVNSQTLPVMHSIYDFLSSKCSSREISTHCSEDCKKIGHSLRNSKCVFIAEHSIFVKGDQLSFSVPGEHDGFQPFIYVVPREYGKYENFLKRLGATEKMSADQVVEILKKMKDEYEGEIPSTSWKKVLHCIYMFFALIVDDGWKFNEATLTELFLPSVDHFLVRSNELVCQVPPHLSELPLGYNILVPFHQCGLQRERQDDYISALPEIARPKSFSALLREELDPSCENDFCTQDDDNVCTLKERLVETIGSDEFQEGILRLMQHQNSGADITKIKELSLRFTWIKPWISQATIKCMKSIKMRLVNIETESVIEGSSNEHKCYLVNKGDSWTLYIKHGCRSAGLLSNCVNQIIESYLDKDSLRAFGDMLVCDTPEDISKMLDEHGIEKNFSDEISISKDLQQDVEGLKTGGGAGGSDAREDRNGDVRSGNQGSWTGGGGTRSSSSEFGGTSGVRRHSSMQSDYFFEDVDYTVPDPKEAKRWMSQSRLDLQVAEFLLSRSSYYAMVCFLCHQIAEKTLKAALYAKQGLSNAQLHTHNIFQLVRDLPHSTSIVAQVRHVSGYYLPTRYPNRQPGNLVPGEQFGKDEATQAVENAKHIERFIETQYIYHE